MKAMYGEREDITEYTVRECKDTLTYYSDSNTFNIRVQHYLSKQK